MEISAPTLRAVNNLGMWKPEPPPSQSGCETQMSDLWGRIKNNRCSDRALQKNKRGTLCCHKQSCIGTERTPWCWLKCLPDQPHNHSRATADRAHQSVELPSVVKEKGVHLSGALRPRLYAELRAPELSVGAQHLEGRTLALAGWRIASKY